MAYHGVMSRFAPLLRALLCFVLLLNGTAYAHAASRMAMGELAGAAQPSSDDEPPCHEEMADPGGLVDTSQPDAHVHADDAGMPDCCKAGSCDGFCAQHAPALAWPALPDALPPLQAGAPAYRADAHASVRQSHRHRPPILPA